jgi:hypothetical protein
MLQTSVIVHGGKNNSQTTPVDHSTLGASCLLIAALRRGKQPLGRQKDHITTKEMSENKTNLV